MKRLTSTMVGLSLIACALTDAPALAQEQSQLIGVNMVQVKPEMWDEFHDLHKEVFMPAAKKSGAAWRATWTTAFGDSFLFYIVVPLENYAELDQTPPWVEVLGEAGAALAGEKWQQTVAGRQAVIVRSRPDLSIAPTTPAPLALFSRIVVHPGQEGTFEALIVNEVLPAMKKAGVIGYTVSQMALGGSPTEYAIGMPIASYAELDAPRPLVRALGEEGAAQLWAKVAPTIARFETSVIEFDRELSYGVAWQEAGSEGGGQ